MDFGEVRDPFWELLGPILKVREATRPLQRSKSHQEEVQEPPGRGLVGAGSDQGRLGRRFWSQLGPNMGPSWDPKSNKKVLEDDAKRRQFLDGLRDPTWSGFGRVLGAKMDPCWHPKSIPKWMLS